MQNQLLVLQALCFFYCLSGKFFKLILTFDLVRPDFCCTGAGVTWTFEGEVGRTVFTCGIAGLGLVGMTARGSCGFTGMGADGVTAAGLVGLPGVGASGTPGLGGSGIPLWGAWGLPGAFGGRGVPTAGAWLEPAILALPSFSYGSLMREACTAGFGCPGVRDGSGCC